jgi:hypothetical protein
MKYLAFHSLCTVDACVTFRLHISEYDGS